LVDAVVTEIEDVGTAPERRLECDHDCFHNRRVLRLAEIHHSTRPPGGNQHHEFWMGEVDQDNTRWLKGVVAWYGWPTRSMVGDDGAAAAWLLVQHADHDRAFQRRCLVLMQALPADQTSPEHIAYLADRVRSAEN
jgi:hypothetical protein